MKVQKSELQFTQTNLVEPHTNTNGSQFFITHVPTEWLNYKHTIFGEVVSQKDQDVVDSIKQGDTMNEVVIVGDVDKLIEENKEFYTQLKNFLKI